MKQAPLNEAFKTDENGKITSTPWNQWFNTVQKTSTSITHANTGGVPTQPPEKVGDIHVDTNTNTIYVGVNNQSVSGWVTGTGGGTVGPQGPAGPAGPQGPTGSSGGITPGGTGFPHVTSSSLDPTARLIVEADLNLTNISTADVSITKHGFTPIAPNDAAKFLRGDATWAVPVVPSTSTGDGFRHITANVEDAAARNPVLASTDFANQGTATTVLHGNAAGNPAFGAVVEADITLANNTTNNVSITKHGFVPIAPNDTSKFLRGDATWDVAGATPAGNNTYIQFNDSGAFGGSSDFIWDTFNGVFAISPTGTGYKSFRVYLAGTDPGKVFVSNDATKSPLPKTFFELLDTSTSGSPTMSGMTLNVTSGGNSSVATGQEIVVNCNQVSGNNYSARGCIFTVNASYAGTVGSVYPHFGVYGQINANSAVANPNITAFYGDAMVTGVAYCDAVIGIQASAYCAANAAVGSAKGISIQIGKAAGTISDAYGLYMFDVSDGGTNHALYTGKGLNKLGDQLLIVGWQDVVQNIVRANGTQTTNLQQWQDSSNNVMLAIAGNGRDFVIDTTTGSKIGTATSQKLAFWNTAPIVQPTTGVGAATFAAGAGTAVDDAATFDGYTLGQVVKALRNIGLLA